MYDPNFRFSVGPFKGRGLYEPAVIRALATDHGIGPMSMAMDAQPQLQTTPNNGVPAYLANFIDPDTIRILFSPTRAGEIFGDGDRGERKRGTFADVTATFPVAEHTGHTSSYGDFNNNGDAGVNFNWPQRQQYLYQTIINYGVLETERLGLASVDLIGQKREAATTVIAQDANRLYFYGVAGLQNYGILNDPSLSASIQPGPKAYQSQANGPWVTNGRVTATPNEVYDDILALFNRIVAQTSGIISIDSDTPMTLVVSPTRATALAAANNFNVMTEDLIKKVFPNLRIVQAPQLDTPAGSLAILIANNVDGQETGYVAYAEKLRAFPVVQELSAQRQKLAGSTWGAIIRQPAAVATMIGV